MKIPEHGEKRCRCTVEPMSAEEIKKIRLSIHRTQTSFAELLGVKRLTVTRWENGKNTPGRDALIKLWKIKKHLDGRRAVDSDGVPYRY